MTTPAAPATGLPYPRIIHPSDFTEDSHTGLVHAIKLTLAAQGELSVMHVDPDVARADFEDFPKVRPILERWGVLPKGSRREQVRDLGITIKKPGPSVKLRLRAFSATSALIRPICW